MNKLKISVLDTVPMGPGMDSASTLHSTLELAGIADRSGCHRYWLVEHHSVADIGSSSPPVLIAHLAAQTSQIRLGSGGVMLPNHPPLVVAEQFTTLQALYPGRIDLGVGRASGTNDVTARALRRLPENASPEGFERQLDELLGFMGDSFDDNHEYKDVHISLKAPSTPVFLLGASTGSAISAAKRGMHYAYAYHINPAQMKEAVKEYRNQFNTEGYQQSPYVFSTFSVVCAETDQQARQSAEQAALIRLRLLNATKAGRALTEAEIDLGTVSAEELLLARQMLKANKVAIGSGERVAKLLTDAARIVGLDEVMITFIQFDGEDRKTSLQTLMDALNSVSRQSELEVTRAA